MEFRADLVDGTSAPAHTGAAGLRVYKSAIDATSESLAKLQKMTGNAPPARAPSPVIGAVETPKAIAARVAAEAKAAAQIAAIAEKGAQARATAEVKAAATIRLAREKMAAADNAQRNKAMASLVLAQAKAKPGGARSGKPGSSGAAMAPDAGSIGGGLAEAQKRTEDYYAKVRAAESGASKASEAASEKKAAKAKAFGNDAMAVAKGIALAGAGALGAGGAMGLAKMAIGYKGMMQLQGITYRASIAFRGLFSGVDSSPLIRSVASFTSNLSKSTVTGQALSGILTRGFNGVFTLIERATPYVTAFTQGLLIGFLQAENGILRARIAFYPYTSTLESATGSTRGLTAAAGLGTLAVGAMGAKAIWTGGQLVVSAVKGVTSMVSLGAAGIAAAVPYIALAAAIGAVALAISQASKLSKEWDSNSDSQIWAKLKQDVTGTHELPKGMTTGADYDKMMAAKGKPVAGAGGVGAGAALGAGMIKGMADSEAAVMAGGAALSKAAVKGAKAEAEIRSPSRKTRREVGRELGAGVEKGLDDSGPGVQAAAEKNLVPSMSGASVGGGGGGRTAGALPPIQIGPFIFPELRSGARDDIEAAISAATPRIVDEVTRFIAIQLGISTEAAA